MQSTLPNRENILEPLAHHPFHGGYSTLDAHNAFKKMPPGIFNLEVLNANSYTVTTPDWLQPDAISKIVDKFAPLKAYTTVFEPNPIAPKAQNQIKFVTTAGATQQNPTNYQGGGSVVNAVPVPVTHFSQLFQVTNLEYNKGARIEDLFLENALTLGDTIAGAVNTTMTAVNFPATAISVVPANFTLSDAASAFTAIKKCGSKNLILDGDYFARLTHIAGFDAATRYGWDGIFQQSAGWASADPNVRGFACGPTAILIVTGFLRPIINGFVKQRFVSLGDLGIVIEYNQWFETSTRTYFASLDVVLGAAASGDTASGVLIKSP